LNIDLVSPSVRVCIAGGNRKRFVPSISKKGTVMLVKTRLSCFVSVCLLCACEDQIFYPPSGDSVADTQDLSKDAATGIPYALTFQHPMKGFGPSDYGFGFGQLNTAFCMHANAQKECTSYGYHLGRDTQVAETPMGTSVYAPADGIVRISTDKAFGGFGSDTSTNSQYSGCLIVLEHLLKNKQAIITLLGHLKCESSTTYDPDRRKGNPRVGTVVKRGQYVAHVASYWHGADQSNDWHHLHWAMRKGRFSSSSLNVYVAGYAPRSEFTTDATTGALVHPSWVDPLLMVSANVDSATPLDPSVRTHPSGTLLQDVDGAYWFVKADGEIAEVPMEVLLVDRYDTGTAVRISEEEMSCYRRAGIMSALGHVTLYVRPGASTVVMAYDQSWDRYDVVRWEALLSWGYDDQDLIDQASAAYYESSYRNRGMRMLRPGTLVKADEASEVAIVTAQQTRRPIVSGDVFEQAGFQWERIVSVPQSVLDAVAGPRENHALTADGLHACPASGTCPDVSTCGGGALPEEPSSDREESGGGEEKGLRLTYHAPWSGPVAIQGWWQNSDGSSREWDVIPCSDDDPQDDLLACDLPVPSGASQFEFQMYLSGPAYWGDESCNGGGCGEPLGSLELSKGAMSIAVSMIPNSSGPPYYNGRVAPVP
jgi:hypothetical protein